jgi:hypothetical protein
VPNTPTSTALVKVTAHDAAGNIGEDTSNAVFTIGAPDTTAPVVTVTAPNGGESWAAGSAHNITWTATDDVGVTAVDLYYSTDGGVNFTTIATGVANTGSYAWTVPNAATANGIVKVVAHDGSANTAADVSNAPFTITAPVGNPNDIYVWDMAWSQTQKGNWITVSVTVFVKRDSDGDGVAEASDAAASGVAINLTLDHFVNGVLFGTTTYTNAKTNGTGQVTFNLKTQTGGTFRATATSLTKAGWSWNTRLDQDNPSWYPAPLGTMVPGTPRLVTVVRRVARDGRPLPNGSPTLPAVAFHSESPLFQVEEILPIGYLTPTGGGSH